MNSFSLLCWAFAISIGASAMALHAEEAVPEGRVRAAITRSLDFLAREGDQWMNEKDCNACHHLPVLIWSHREAVRRGFAIDGKKFEEFVEWADERARKSKASDETLALLRLARPEQVAPEVTKLIADGQMVDGAWKVGGQFKTMQRREVVEATETSTRLFLLALATQSADMSAVDTARVKAAAVTARNEPAQSVETLVFRLLYARRFGPPEQVDTLRAEILKLQHPDGGWGWMIAEPQSDPLATGEALYAVLQVADASRAGAVARAQGWLIGSQREDGGWGIDITRISRIDRSAPEKAKSLKDATGIYTFWGSAWAAIGLLEGLPVPKG